MGEEHRLTLPDRRTVLKATGAVASASVLAGCPDDEDEPVDDEVDDDEVDDDEVNDEPEEALDPDEEIELGGEVQAWFGQSPEQIEEEENPTLTFVEGESYTFVWENLDGQPHNIEIVDEDDEVVDDYSTDEISEEGETQELEVDEVTEEMAEYVCRPHEGTMRGSIEVVEDDEEENDEEPEDDEEENDE